MKHYSKRFVSLILALIICLGMIPVVNAAEDTAMTDESAVSEQISDSSVYLSDIGYESASIGWGVLHLDGNMNDEPISLYIDGNRYYFDKGMTAHASSTIIYNLADYKQYSYFTSYIGVDASQGTKGSVIFHIYTSSDGSTWDEVYTSNELTASSEAEFVSLDISQAAYLKLYTDQNGGNGNDHSTFADAKLSENPGGSDYAGSIKTLEEYDELLSEYRSERSDYAFLLENEDFEYTLLQRTFVKNAGYKSLMLLCQQDEKYSEIIEWLLGNKEVLSLYIMGGAPEGSYQKSFEVLYDLLAAHGDDIADSQYGDLYLRMIIALSLTHSATVFAWYDGTAVSDPVYRYEIYKDLHSDGLLWNDIFENLTVEEMRWVVNNMMRDDEIKALNTYVRENNSLTDFTYENWCNINGYTYITYTMDYRYPEHPSIFDIFEEGAVCGGISKSSCNIREVFGVPAATVYQPGHCAWLDYRYNVNTEGNNIVYIGNNISGWPKSHREYDSRMFCGWGNADWRRSSYCASYTLLSRAALNDYDNYQVAEMLVNMCSAFPDEAADICREALSYQSFNLDAYSNLIYATAGCDESESFAVINEITENMYGYPLPMWDLLNLLKKTHNLTSDSAVGDIMMITLNALNAGSNITAENSLQPDACKQMSNSILSLNSYALADFSLAGENAGVLQLASDFSENANMQYSIDGGESWINTNSVSVNLSDEELSSLTAENDILVRVEGMEYYYTIDISKANAPTGLYNNDLENKVICADDTMEWSFDGAEWTSFAVSAPDLSGDKTVLVRYATAGTVFASDAVELTYTADNIDIKKSYITLDRVSVTGCSTEASAHGEYAYKAIDGNINTYWHTSWNWDSDSERYITFELDSPTYLSAIDYVPRQDSGSNGIFINCEVYTSLDGESWTLAASAEGWAINKSIKTIVFDEAVYAKYVKVVGTQAASNFGSAAMINFYEDLTGSIGDVDMDGEVTVLDATYIQKICADVISADEKQMLLGDTDGDGRITVSDATEIQRYCALLIDSFSAVTSQDNI